MFDKKSLTERDICTKFITPAIVETAGWNRDTQIREEFLLDGIPRMTGTAGQKRVPSDYFALNPFPLPPLEEQKRIVAKVDELMRLCDQLEEQQQARRESRTRLNNAVLAPLNNAASLAPEQLEQASA
jgi:type I restriction enzyme S subunit